jgi:DNA polymerase-3 subunit alpha (Gram-positive type)
MIAFDVETTGLLVVGESDPLKQPYMTEIAAIKVNDALEEIDRFSTLINPGIPIPPEVTAINGIDDAAVKDAPSFPVALMKFIRPFWLGEQTVVGYNVEFDLGILLWALRRHAHEHRFPYCWDVIDAIQWRNGRRIKLEAWSKEVLGDAWTPQTHRAMGDTERLLACMRKSRKEKT